MKNIFKKLLAWLFGSKETPPVVKPVEVPDKQPEPAPIEVKPEPVITPTEPPIIIEPVPLPPVVEPEPPKDIDIPQSQPDMPVEVIPEPVKVEPIPEPIVPPPVIIAEPIKEPVKPDPVIEIKPEVPIIKIPTPEPLPPAAEIPKPSKPLTLKDSPVKFGLAWKDADSKRTEVIDEANKHFESYTPENAAKPWHVHKNGKFDFTNLKALIKIAKGNGSRVHGHACFVWPIMDGILPDILKDEKNYKANITSFITTVLTEFPEIGYWDLINEAFSDDGTLKDCMAKRAWGDNYIKEIFKIAYKANPKAKFFMSDYNLQTNSKQAIAEVKYVAEMVKEGLPIHGFSSQMHITIDSFVVKNFESTLKAMVATGLLIHFSELDIKVGMKQVSEKDKDGKITKLFPFTSALKAKQAATAKQVVQSYFKLVPLKQQHGITLWSFTHMRNYMNIRYKYQTDYPAVFDEKFDGGFSLPAILEVK